MHAGRCRIVGHERYRCMQEDVVLLDMRGRCMQEGVVLLDMRGRCMQEGVVGV